MKRVWGIIWDRNKEVAYIGIKMLKYYMIAWLRVQEFREKKIKQ